MRLYNFYFFDETEKRRLLIAEATERECMNEMNKFLSEHNYKPKYVRSWSNGNEVWFDVGSWSEFFVMVDSNV